MLCSRLQLAGGSYLRLASAMRLAVSVWAVNSQRNAAVKQSLFRFLNTQYNRAHSAAPELINDAPRIDARFITKFCRRIKLQEGIFYKSLGTLGGGNHLMEYGEDEKTQEAWLTIHCSSWNLGAKVVNHWRNVAQNPKKANFIGYLWGDALNGYLSDMVLAQTYALYNHHVIRDRIFAILKKLCKAKCVESVFTMHNHIAINEEYPMLRKRAVRAAEGEKFCLPFNMRDALPSAWVRGMQSGTTRLRMGLGA